MNDLTLFALYFFNLAIGGMCGHRRGHAGAGVALALFLGPLGWALVFLLPDRRRTCPHCRSGNDQHATVCAHCGRALVSRTQSARFIPPQQIDDDPLGIYRKKP